jgi:predicted N-acetyltransferase YhbS
MQIRSMEAGDVAGAARVLAAAHKVEFDFGPMLRRNQAVSPKYWWVMAEGDAVAGVVGATDYETFAHIGLMAMDPGVQMAGAGTILLEYCLERLKGDGFQSITLYSTDAGLAFYPKFGFRWAGLSTEWVLRKRKAHRRRYEVGRDLSGVAQWDREVFGGDRWRLIERLDEEAPGRVLVARDQAGEVEGFAVVQPVLIGPIAASSREVAGDLIDAALDLEFKAAPRLILPEAHGDGEELVIAMGFGAFRTSRYFIWGDAPRQRRGWMYGQGAYSLG